MEMWKKSGLKWMHVHCAYVHAFFTSVDIPHICVAEKILFGLFSLIRWKQAHALQDFSDLNVWNWSIEAKLMDLFRQMCLWNHINQFFFLWKESTKEKCFLKVERKMKPFIVLSKFQEPNSKNFVVESLLSKVPDHELIQRLESLNDFCDKIAQISRT